MIASGNSSSEPAMLLVHAKKSAEIALLQESNLKKCAATFRLVKGAVAHERSANSNMRSFRPLGH